MGDKARRISSVGLFSSTVLTVCLVLLALGESSRAQTLSVDGVVESAGLEFPDGTIQTTAAIQGRAMLSETGQQVCWDFEGTEISCSGTGQDGELQTGLQWPSPRFVDNGDGTVTDVLTGLTWLQDANCPLATKTWQESLDWVAAFNAGGSACTNYSAGTFSDWRLPNVTELGSLVDFGTNSPALPPGNGFLEVQSGYWSATTVFSNRSFAWTNTIVVGIYNVSSKANPSAVWPVRGGR